MIELMKNIETLKCCALIFVFLTFLSNILSIINSLSIKIRNIRLKGCSKENERIGRDRINDSEMKQQKIMITENEIKKEDSILINVNGWNLARDIEIQYNPMADDELEKILQSIIDNLNGLDQENADMITDVVEMAREELTRPEPSAGRLRDCLSLISPIIAVANGIPALEDNLQKFVSYLQMFIH